MNNLYQTVLKIIIIIAALMIIFKICLIFLWPFMASAFLVLLIEPIVKFFLKNGFSRNTSVALSYIFMFLLVFICSFILSKYIFVQLISFIQNATIIMEFIAKKYNFIPWDKIDYDSIINAAKGMLMSYKSGILNTLLSTFNGFINLVVIIICSLFVSLDFDKFIAFICNLFPFNAVIFLKRIYFKLNKIIKLQLQLILISTVQTVVGLYVLGINNALTIGIICGILDMLPIVGIAMVFIPLTIYEFSISRPMVGIGLILLFVLLQVLREVLKIKLVGKKLDLHPLITVICLYYGLYIYGIPGLLLGPILVVIIIELYHEYAGRSKIT